MSIDAPRADFARFDNEIRLSHVFAMNGYDGMFTRATDIEIRKWRARQYLQFLKSKPDQLLLASQFFEAAYGEKP